MQSEAGGEHGRLDGHDPAAVDRDDRDGNGNGRARHEWQYGRWDRCERWDDDQRNGDAIDRYRGDRISAGGIDNAVVQIRQARSAIAARGTGSSAPTLPAPLTRHES